jgi:hypothetical protein
MVFNATFNNISVILCQSVLFVVETGPPGENHRPVTSHWQNLSHNVVSSTPRHERDSNHNLSGDRHWLHRVEHVSMHDKHNLALCLNELLYSRQNTTKTILLQWNLCEPNLKNLTESCIKLNLKFQCWKSLYILPV